MAPRRVPKRQKTTDTRLTAADTFASEMARSLRYKGKQKATDTQASEATESRQMTCHHTSNDEELSPKSLSQVKPEQGGQSDEASRKKTSDEIWTGYHVTRELGPMIRHDDPKTYYFADLMSLTAQTAFEHLSFEEIRLTDYMKGGGPLDSVSQRRRRNLTLAFVPKPCGRCRFVFESDRSICFAEHKFQSRKMIFYVGELADQFKFHVYETFIPSRSMFIREELEKDWEGNFVAEYKLPKVDIRTFTLYHQWVLTGCIFSYNLAEMCPETTEYEFFMKGYILGQQLADVNFKDTLIDCIIHKLNTTDWFDLHLTGLVWKGAREDSHLRRLWLDIYFWSGNQNWLNEKLLRDSIDLEARSSDSVGGSIDLDFLAEFARYRKRLAEDGLPPDPPYIYGGCDYHEHGERSCYRLSDGL